MNNEMIIIKGNLIKYILRSKYARSICLKRIYCFQIQFQPSTRGHSKGYSPTMTRVECYML